MKERVGDGKLITISITVRGINDRNSIPGIIIFIICRIVCCAIVGYFNGKQERDCLVHFLRLLAVCW